MSMHEMETLFECSVLVIANSGDKLDKTSKIQLCYNLYRLQDLFFDCHCPLEKVSSELEELGYLTNLPLDQLPEPERHAASTLAEKSGYFAPGTYLNAETGIVSVTAGSGLWDRLSELQIIPSLQAGPFTVMSPIALAEIILPLAAEQTKAGNEDATYALGLWYLLLPSICMATEYYADPEFDPARILSLLEIVAMPEAFEVVEVYCSPAELVAMDDEIPFFPEWRAPYFSWLEKRDCETERETKIRKLLADGQFVEADRLARLAEGRTSQEYRATIALTYHINARQLAEKAVPCPELLTLEETKQCFEKLRDEETEPALKSQYGLFVAQCQFMAAAGTAAVASLRVAFEPVLETLKLPAATEQQRLLAATTAEKYFELLVTNIPQSVQRQNPQLLCPPPSMLSPAEAREIFAERLAVDPADLQLNKSLAILLLAEQKTVEAKRLIANFPELNYLLSDLEKLLD